MSDFFSNFAPNLAQDRKMTTEEFIHRAKQVHGDKYDYSKVEYAGSKAKVCVICHEHGEFWQRPDCHLDGQRCPICAKIEKSEKQIKWDYNRCYEEAQKYHTRSEFYRHSGYAYKLSLENGWLDNFTWLVEIYKPAGYWTYETCFEEAKKYKSRTEFSKKSQSAYQVAREAKWLDDYNWFKSDTTPSGYWTFENCSNEAKKYKTIAEFCREAPYLYRLASEKGWLADFNWLERKFTWTYEECFTIAKQFKTKSDFKKGHPRAYDAALRHKWMKNFDWMVKARVNVITGDVDNVYLYLFEEFNTFYIGRTINKKRRDREHIFNADNDAVAKFALDHNCSVPPMIILEENLTLAQGQEREDYWIKYYKRKGYRALNKAKTGRGVGSLGTLECKKWTKKTCYEEAKKYSSIKAFQLGNISAYTRALKRGWLSDYTWFQTRRTWNNVWNKDNCRKEAQKYETVSLFRKNNESAYRVARKNGWLDEFFPAK
ncbi:MAG: GIY-YIG nuclease family protein [Paludibacteraceae bacterium]|nr:GIY-YIG nuclease family protein [Paludibacteraceae bacterium]